MLQGVIGPRYTVIHDLYTTKIGSLGSIPMVTTRMYDYYETGLISRSSHVFNVIHGSSSIVK